MGKNQQHNRQHLGALENSIIGNFLSIMWKSLEALGFKKRQRQNAGIEDELEPNHPVKRD